MKRFDLSRRASRWGALVVLLALGLAAATGVSGLRSAKASESASSFVPGRDASYATSPCPDPNFQPPGNPVPNPFAVLNLPKGTVCGVLTVPEDRSVPDGPKIRLGVAEVKASSSHPKPDPIVYLTGGPGGSAIVTAIKQINGGLNRDRDVIFIDQRGEYHSEPRLTCPEIDNFMVHQLGLSVLAPSTKAKDLAAVRACRTRLAGHGYDLAAFNTPENAADIADLRVAMGIKQWNVYGVSYGTDLALQLMRDYPQGIRSVVLDSLVPPQVNLINQFWVSAAQGYRALFAACAEQPACHRAYPNLAGQFTAAVNRLARHPLTVHLPAGAGQPARRVVIDGYTLANLVVVASLSAGSYSDLPLMIHQIAAGDGTRVAQTLAASVAEAPPGLVAYGLAYGVFCREGVAFTSQAGELAAARRALPAFPKSVLTLVPQAARIIPECRVWDVGRADRAALAPTHSHIRTLLLTGTLDAVTPPSQAYLAAKTLSRSTVIPLRGLGHDTLDASSCARSIIRGFFDRPAGGYDTACAKTLKNPAFLTPPLFTG